LAADFKCSGVALAIVFTGASRSHRRCLGGRLYVGRDYALFVSQALPRVGL